MTFKEALKDPTFLGYRYLLSFYQVCNELNQLEILKSTSISVASSKSGRDHKIKRYVLINC